jgi:hypothetical protein
LIDAAVTAYLQVKELGARFERARATNPETDRLNLARSALSRILRQLGLTGPTEEPQNDTPPGGGLDEYMAHQGAGNGQEHDV